MTNTNSEAVASSSSQEDELSARGERIERRRMLSFLTVVSTIFFSGTWFVCMTWDHFSGLPLRAGWGIVPYLLSAMFIGSLLAGMRVASFWVRLAYKIAAVWLGVLNFWLFAALACWIALGIFRAVGFRLEGRAIAEALYGLALLAGVYGVANAAWLRVTRVTVKLPHLPAAWRGQEVALITDMHLGNIRGAAFARRVVNRVRSLKPFAVFMSGDMFDGPKADYAKLAEPCRELAPPAGTYFVTGNHEEFSDRAKYIAAVAGAGVRVLNNEKVTVQGLQIVGVHDGEAVEPEQLRSVLRGAGLERNCASILLSHRPSNLATVEEAGISLQVSGHTHKGQFWPWSWVIFNVHGPFAYGLNRLGNLQVVTSSGAGTWGPPMRVNTKSEIVLIRLENSDRPD